MSYYETAQVCKNGHVITDAYSESAELAKPFCPECGQPTITKCEHCDAEIQGRVHLDSVISSRKMERAPAYCFNCGEPFPWTRSHIEAVHELLELDGKIDDADRDTMRNALPDLLAETPKTQVAVVKAKAVMGRMEEGTYEAIKVIISGFASETVRKALFNF
jgi:hypothetical protein